jgi:hypothetical protein
MFFLLFLAATATAKLVTIRNDVARLDTNGNVIDCHSGMILAVNGVFYLYGERYTNSKGFGPSPPQLFPKIVVYTSPDLMAWTYQGEVLNDWPTKPVCQEILYAMQEAWNTKRPWSNHYHAKRDGRYAVTIIASRWGIAPQTVEQMVEAWLINEVIEVSTADYKTKTRGLKVMRTLYDEGSPPANANWYDD